MMYRYDRRFCLHCRRYPIHAFLNMITPKLMCEPQLLLQRRQKPLQSFSYAEDVWGFATRVRSSTLFSHCSRITFEFKMFSLHRFASRNALLFGKLEGMFRAQLRGGR